MAGLWNFQYIIHLGPGNDIIFFINLTQEGGYEHFSFEMLTLQVMFLRVTPIIDAYSKHKHLINLLLRTSWKSNLRALVALENSIITCTTTVNA